MLQESAVSRVNWSVKMEKNMASVTIGLISPDPLTDSWLIPNFALMMIKRLLIDVCRSSCCDDSPDRNMVIDTENKGYRSCR